MRAMGKKWSAAEDTRLTALWSDTLSIQRISTSVGRSVCAVYIRAQTLGLPLGILRGFESLRACCARTGYSIKQLRRILRAGKVAIRPVRTLPRGKKHHYYVDPFDVDEAIAEWLKRESADSMARRLGVGGNRLRRSLARIGIQNDADGRMPIRVTESEALRALGEAA